MKTRGVAMAALIMLAGCGTSSTSDQSAGEQTPDSTGTDSTSTEGNPPETSTVTTTTSTDSSTSEPTTSAPSATTTPTAPPSSPYSSLFEQTADNRLRQQGLDLADACSPLDPTTRTILAAYGSAFVASYDVQVPPTCIFVSNDAVLAFQDDPDLATRVEQLGGLNIELQAAAMDALIAAINDARAAGLDITPNGADAARRDFPTTERLWTSRVDPALDYWSNQGRITADDVARIRALSPVEQVPEVLALETQQIWFNTQFTRTILSSVAAPGTSQHLSMLAVDLTQANSRAVQDIMAQHGWFQTVLDDRFHFTYLGVTEDQLPGLGLVLVDRTEHRYWVPDLG